MLSTYAAMLLAVFSVINAQDFCFDLNDELTECDDSGFDTWDTSTFDDADALEYIPFNEDPLASLAPTDPPTKILVPKGLGPIPYQFSSLLNTTFGTSATKSLPISMSFLGTNVQLKPMQSRMCDFTPQSPNLYRIPLVAATTTYTSQTRWKIAKHATNPNYFSIEFVGDMTNADDYNFRVWANTTMGSAAARLFLTLNNNQTFNDLCTAQYGFQNKICSASVNTTCPNSTSTTCKACTAYRTDYNYFTLGLATWSGLVANQGFQIVGLYDGAADGSYATNKAAANTSLAPGNWYNGVWYPTGTSMLGKPGSFAVAPIMNGIRRYFGLRNKPFNDTRTKTLVQLFHAAYVQVRNETVGSGNNYTRAIWRDKAVAFNLS